MTMVEQGLRLWEQAPLLGNGLDSFRGLSGQGTYAHNNYIELLADGGVVAVVLFYTIHLFILWHGWSLPKSLKICCVLFIVFLMAVDFGCVGYKRKQTVMILMMFMSMVTLAKTRAVPQPKPIRSGSALPQVIPWRGVLSAKRGGRA
jgi:O-antigen ligase